MTVQCDATTKAGTQCPNRAMPGLDQCFSHAPELAERRQQGRVEGGINKRTERRVLKRIPQDIRGTMDVLFRTLQGLEDGSVDPSRAQAIATVSRAICTAWETGMIEAKVQELEDRIASKTVPTPIREDVA